MDGRNVNQRPPSGNPAPERRAELQRLARRWVRLLALVEQQRRLDAGQPVLRIARDDPAG